MTQASAELLQFPYSHFNEKARWALDHKRVPHQRRNLLPGPHAVQLKRLTGQSSWFSVSGSEGQTVHEGPR